MEVGHHPEITLAGRRINDSMAGYLATRVIRLMLQRQIELKGAKVLVLGVTFKRIVLIQGIPKLQAWSVVRSVAVKLTLMTLM